MLQGKHYHHHHILAWMPVAYSCIGMQRESKQTARCKPGSLHLVAQSLLVLIELFHRATDIWRPQPKREKRHSKASLVIGKIEGTNISNNNYHKCSSYNMLVLWYMYATVQATIYYLTRPFFQMTNPALYIKWTCVL